MRAAVPSTIASLLGASLPCGCGRPHTVELRQAILERGAVTRVVEAVRGVLPAGRVAVLVDRVTRAVCGDHVAQELARAGFDTSTLEVPDGDGERPHATRSNVDLVLRGLPDRDLVVAVGSGTVNDLAKLASFERGIPYVVVPTAPSMNGYTSAIAAILERGVKRTVPCHQPVALVADLDILTAAPRHLVAAGLGDLESKPTATADYRLSAALRGDHYCAIPEQVVLGAERRVAESAAALGEGDPEAIAVLFEALVLSGISMKLAGSSGPASGGEHLLSHYWDMTAPRQGRVEGWHGAQVGVATLATAALYEELGTVDPSRFDIDSLVKDRPTANQQVLAARQRWGEQGDEVAAELLAKLPSDVDLRRQLEQVRDTWTDLFQGLADVLRPSQAIRDILRQGRAPTTMGELALGEQHLVQALRHAREIRRRFTVLDLAYDLGVAEQLEPLVLKRAAVVTA